MANILIIDDEDKIRDAISNALTIDGHNVLEAANYDEVKIILNKAISLDVIFLDLILPEVNGLQILKYIKNERKIESPVIILTGHGDMESAVEALRIGAYDYRIKPIHRNDLLNVVKNAQIKNEFDEIKKKLIQKETLAELGIIYTGIKHSIKGPLIKIGIAIDNIKSSAKNKSILNEIKNIDKLTQKVNSIVTDLDNLIQIIRKYDKIEVDFIDVEKEIEFAIADIKETYPNHFNNLKIIKDVEKDLRIKITVSSMELILENLLINSVQAIKKKYISTGKIIVRAKRSKKKIILEIEDNGCGIQEKYNDRIFSPFFTIKEEEEGNGLGLFIVKKISEVYRGEIKYETKENIGTKFTISFPASEVI